MEEEYEILESVLKDFNTKYVDKNSLDIENKEISGGLLNALAEQGFFSIGYEKEEKNVDLRAYSIILETLARLSPSLSVKTMLVNSFLSLVKDKEIMEAVSIGKKSGTVTFSDILAEKIGTSKLEMKDGKVTGTKEFVMGSTSDFIVTLVESGELVLLKSGFKPGKKYKKLGFRSIEFSETLVDSTDFEVLEKNGREALLRAYDAISIPVSAIAIGIGRGASDKAIEYGKVRSAFGHYLKDFQPLAFDTSSLVGELEIVKNYYHHLASSSHSAKEALFLKTKALKLAKEISKSSLQIHGGYGYLEDFGVEKFYRDSMALSVLFHNEEKDLERLSGMVFDSKAGFV